MECIKCKGKRIATGYMPGGRSGRCIFAPDGLRFGAFTASYGTKLQGFACLDCGFVWFVTEPKELEEFIRKHCDQRID